MAQPIGATVKVTSGEATFLKGSACCGREADCSEAGEFSKALVVAPRNDVIVSEDDIKIDFVVTGAWGTPYFKVEHRCVDEQKEPTEPPVVHDPTLQCLSDSAGQSFRITYVNTKPYDVDLYLNNQKGEPKCSRMVKAQSTATVDFSGSDCHTVKEYKDEGFHLTMSNTLSVEMPLEIHEYDPVCEFSRTFNVSGAQHVYKPTTPKGPLRGKGDPVIVHAYFLGENEEKLTEKEKAEQGEPLSFVSKLRITKKMESIWTTSSSTRHERYHMPQYRAG